MDKLIFFINGAFKENHMRFLVETKCTVRIVVNLYNKDNHKIKYITIVDGLSTLTIDCSSFNGPLYQLVHYTVDLDDNINCFNGSFPIISSDYKNHLRIATVSCNANQRKDDDTNYGYKRIDQGVDLWNHLASLNIDIIIHCGDQIYGDYIVKHKKRLTDDEIYECYADLYRTAYSEESQQRAMRNSLNIMMVDDHDFDDSFATPGEGREKKDKKFTPYYKSAMKAFLNYQHSLVTDIDNIEAYIAGEIPVYYLYKIGRYTVVVLDERIEWYHKGLVFSDEQLGWLDNILSKTTDDIVIVSPRPIGHVSRNSAKLQSILVADGKDELLHPLTYNRTIRLLDILAKYDNDIVILSGDIHKTYINEIYKEDKLVARHLCASGITVKPKCYEGFFSRSGYKLQTIISSNRSGDIRFTKKRAVSHNNNYGLYVSGKLSNVFIRDP